VVVTEGASFFQEVKKKKKKEKKGVKDMKANGGRNIYYVWGNGRLFMLLL